MSPNVGSKWVGLYPRISVASKTPMTAAYLQLGDETLVGKLKSRLPSRVLSKRATNSRQNL